MTTFKLLGVALILAAAGAAPVAAQSQEAIQEPGNYAFYHPNGDLLHARSSNAFASQRSDFAGVQLAVRPHKRIAVRTARRY